MTDLSPHHSSTHEELIARIRDLKDRIRMLTDRREVRNNMIQVLRQMLCETFHRPIDATTGRAHGSSPLLHEADPVKAVELSRLWVSYHFPDQTQNCDRNSRVCFATLVGNINKDWVVASSSPSPSPSPSPCPLMTDCNSVVEWTTTIYPKFLVNTNQNAMLVRFIAEDDPTGGHSLVSIILYAVVFGRFRHTSI